MVKRIIVRRKEISEARRCFVVVGAIKKAFFRQISRELEWRGQCPISPSGLVLKLMPCFSVSALNGFWEELSENQSPSTDSLNPTK